MEDPYSEFCRLAKQYRARQSLVHRSEKTKKSTGSGSSTHDAASTQQHRGSNTNDETMESAAPLAEPATTAMVGSHEWDPQVASIVTEQQQTQAHHNNFYCDGGGRADVGSQSCLATVCTSASSHNTSLASPRSGAEKRRPPRHNPNSNKNNNKEPRHKTARRRHRTSSSSSSTARRSTATTTLKYGHLQQHRTSAFAAYGSIDNNHCARATNALQPEVEEAMLKAFKGRGVSVPAIRDLYRERHKRRVNNICKDRESTDRHAALDEVRRWWRVGCPSDRSNNSCTSSSISIGELAVTSSTGFETSGDEETVVIATDSKGMSLPNRRWGDDVYRCVSNSNDDHYWQAEDLKKTSENEVVHVELPFQKNPIPSEHGNNSSSSGSGSAGVGMGSNGFSPSLHTATRHVTSGIDSTTPAESREHLGTTTPIGSTSTVVVFDDLKWQQVLADDWYRADLVRNIKQALRAGRAVKLRASIAGARASISVDACCAPPSLGRSCFRPRSADCSKDCLLMLKTLYMQSVQVSLLEHLRC